MTRYLLKITAACLVAAALASCAGTSGKRPLAPARPPGYHHHRIENGILRYQAKFHYPRPGKPRPIKPKDENRS